jgi:copper(I)-binding protein
MNIAKVLFPVLTLFAACGAAQADIEVSDAYVRGLPPGVANTSAYMTLRNTGTTAVDLTGARSSMAATVMLHDTMNHDGMLHMMHVDKATIPAGGELTLVSGGMHLMLMQLREQPAVGSSVELLLQFSDGSELSVQAPVRSVLDE